MNTILLAVGCMSIIMFAVIIWSVLVMGKWSDEAAQRAFTYGEALSNISGDKGNYPREDEKPET